ncbi:NAD-dependent epimerase/dehydratase family protein [Actinomadura madurae]|uniref:NAD-dependent epimerase/dehydratase family protein n=1 Tax=Actinomadura madurae TaxID=1993 RepID=UPI0020D201ED|nr:NAD(P)-dependent oxidoreductase [Actinomadura madurae]MCP9982379.1 NAD(P)-dependent oxidoreductase [Actinomadura madurae]
MKILLAGATGVVGRRLIPLLVQAGHEVAGTTRRSERAGMLRELGASPVVLDVLNTGDVRAAVAAIDPDAVIHQLTDLADEDFEANSHLRIAGTRNLVDAAKAAGVETMVAQSIAWLYVPGDAPAVETDPLDANLPPYEGIAALESAVSEMPHGVVLRYGALYGPGTWYAPDGAIAERVRAGSLRLAPSWTSFVHADDAASAALAALDWPAGAVNIVDDEPGDHGGLAARLQRGARRADAGQRGTARGGDGARGLQRQGAEPRVEAAGRVVAHRFRADGLGGPGGLTAGPRGNVPAGPVSRTGTSAWTGRASSRR